MINRNFDLVPLLQDYPMFIPEYQLRLCVSQNVCLLFLSRTVIAVVSFGFYEIYFLDKKYLPLQEFLQLFM